MNDKVKNMITLRIILAEKIIQGERIKTHRAGHGKGMPDQREMAKILDIRVIDDEHVIIKHKTIKKSLPVDQKPQDDNHGASQKMI